MSKEPCVSVDARFCCGILLQQEALEQRMCQLAKDGMSGVASFFGGQPVSGTRLETARSSADARFRKAHHLFWHGACSDSADKRHLGTVHAAIQQTNATLTPSMHRFSSQTPPWHGAYIDSADKRHLGTVHTSIQQTNATLAPHMSIFSRHAPRSRRSMELPHDQRPA